MNIKTFFALTNAIYTNNLPRLIAVRHSNLHLLHNYNSLQDHHRRVYYYCIFLCLQDHISLQKHTKCTKIHYKTTITHYTYYIYIHCIITVKKPIFCHCHCIYLLSMLITVRFYQIRIHRHIFHSLNRVCTVTLYSILFKTSFSNIV